MRFDNQEQNQDDDFMYPTDSKMVYVRPVLARDVMDDLVDENGELEVDISGESTLYALHAADGSRLALMGDRDLAFAAARQHEMNPVSVH